VADKLYFIQSGYVQIMSKNDKIPLVYQSKGAYFGEIGVLLTGKRSASVRSLTNSVVYYISADDLNEVLTKAPE
jgi:CRP-like cAMP-binding protein